MLEAEIGNIQEDVNELQDKVGSQTINKLKCDSMFMEYYCRCSGKMREIDSF